MSTSFYAQGTTYTQNHLNKMYVYVHLPNMQWVLISHLLMLTFKNFYV